MVYNVRHWHKADIPQTAQPGTLVDVGQRKDKKHSYRNAPEALVDAPQSRNGDHCVLSSQSINPKNYSIV